MPMYRGYIQLMLLLITCGILFSCDSHTDTIDSQAPSLLPASIFGYGVYSFFEPAQEHSEEPHWRAASGRILVVHNAATSRLASSIAFTDLMDDRNPRFENGTWVWERYTGFMQSSRLILEAEIGHQKIDWKMLVSSRIGTTTEYSEPMQVYAATSTLGSGLTPWENENSSVSWELYDDVGDGARTVILTGEYSAEEINSASDESLEKVTIAVLENNPVEIARGSTIELSWYDNIREVYLEERESTRKHRVSWDIVTKAGWIEAWNYSFGNRACWDQGLNNVECDSL